MPDETTQDELEQEQGATVLPLREMMSTISTDPADPMFSTLVPGEEGAEGPISAEKEPMATLPVEPRDQI